MAPTAPLRDLTALVRPELDRINRELAACLRPSEAALEPLVDHVARYRGKQLRPALVLLAGRAVGAVTDAHIEVAKVVELIHTATLVHDDILDDAEVRRQLPTVNRLHGNEAAVLLGDYVYALAFELSVGLDDPTCARVLGAVVREVCQGEITQILHRLDFDWTEERYYRVIREKTASLYAAAARLGGHYAGAGPEVQRALDTYGTELGIAFQVVDDCLDLDGDEAVVGKSLGTDLDKGKLTLPLLRLLHESVDGGRRLRELVGAPDGLNRLRREFDVAGAVAYSLCHARERIERARAALATLPPGPATDALAEVAGYVISREA